MTVPLYGCPLCGRIGWSRPGERVDGAGEEDGTPMVRRDQRGQPVGGAWQGDCGHPVPADSPLGRCLDRIPPLAVVALDTNRPVEMDDWRPSATH